MATLTYRAEVGCLVTCNSYRNPALYLIKQRWAVDMPLPVRQNIPILIGGDGERFTLRLTAQYADIWNSGASPELFKHKCAVLDQWCIQVGRDPAAIERSVNVYGTPDAATYNEYIAAGAQHIILNAGAPWDLTPVKHLVQWRATRLLE